MDENGSLVNNPELDSLVQFLFGFALDVDFSYTNITSYNRRLNFDYKIEFFDEPIGDTINITNANGSGIGGGTDTGSGSGLVRGSGINSGSSSRSSG